MIELRNSCLYCALEHFYVTRAATDIDFYKLLLSLQKKSMDYFCAKGEIYNVNTWNNVMHYWLLKIVLLLSALNQNEQIKLIESLLTLICQGNNNLLPTCELHNAGDFHLFNPGCEERWSIVASHLIGALHLALPWCYNRHRAESMEKWHWINFVTDT